MNQGQDRDHVAEKLDELSRLAAQCDGVVERLRDGLREWRYQGRLVARQLDRSLPDGATGNSLVVAYEPVWAIGTGLTPTPEDIAAVHAFIRERLIGRFGPDGGDVRLLYGGSVKPTNVGGLLAIPHVNGALVGGASLKAEDFLGIAAIYE